MSVTEANSLNLTQICRTCLIHSENMNDLNGIVENVQLTLNGILMACSQVSHHEDMPNLICSECTGQLINAYNFKLKCEENDKILIDYLTGMKSSPKASNCTEHYEDLSQDPIDIKEEMSLTDVFDSQYDDQCLAEAAADENDESNDRINNSDKVEVEDVKTETEEQCSKVTISFADEILPDEKNKYRCEVCASAYNHKKSLIRHMNNVHDANISNRCKVCKKVYAKGAQLEAHMDTHFKANTWHRCNVCNETFDNQESEKMHRRMHSKIRQKSAQTERRKNIAEPPDLVDPSFCLPNGMKKIQCKICSAQIEKSYELKEHIKGHLILDDSFDEAIIDNELCVHLGLSGLSSREEKLSQLIKCIDERSLCEFYSISNEVGNELTISDSETESDSDDVPLSSYRHTNYKCEICEKIFDRRFRILFHQQTDHSTSDLLHKCNKCSSSFASIQLLNDHLKSLCENKLKRYSCESCSMKFMWNENLKIHKKARHYVKTATDKAKRSDDTKDKKFACADCDKVFSRSEHLYRHKSVHLPANLRKFECDICHKKFNRKDNLRSHMRVHEGGSRSSSRRKVNTNTNEYKSDTENRHLCVYCGRGFTNSSNLIVHMRRHTGEKPYKCDFCGKGFPRSSDLACHRRTHTGEKPHLCTVCGKGFSRSNKLVRHLRIHTGSRPYKCTYCEAAFTQSNDLTLHIRRHTGDKPYVCGICGDRFIQGTALQAHRRSKGHFEGPENDAPFASMSMNNPNRYNSQNRVNRIGLPRQEPIEPIEIKPVGRGSGVKISTADSNADNAMFASSLVETNMSNIGECSLIGVVPAQIQEYLSMPGIAYTTGVTSTLQ